MTMEQTGHALLTNLWEAGPWLAARASEAAEAASESEPSEALVMIFVGTLVFAAHLFVAVFHRFRVPDTLWLIGIGLLIGPVFEWVQPDAFGLVGGVFTTIALIIILFEAGLDLSFKSLSESFGGAAALTFASYFLVGAGVMAFCYYVMGLPFETSLFIGAVVAGPSPPVIIPMVRQLALRPQTRTLITLESAVGEAMCLVIALGILQAVSSENAAIGATVGQVISSFVMAAIIGGIGGYLWAFLLNRLRQLQNTISLTPAMVFIVYGICEFLTFSGPVAALVFGIAIGNVTLIQKWSVPHMHHTVNSWEPTTHSDVEMKFFSEIVFLLKTFFFVYLGLSMKKEDLWSPVAWGVVGILLLARFIAVKGSLNRYIINSKEGTVLATMIPKGLAAAVLGAAAAQTPGLDHGHEAENVIYSVILYSIAATAVFIFLIEKCHLNALFNWWLFPNREQTAVASAAATPTKPAE